MILIIPLIALLFGVGLGLITNHPLTGDLGQYLAVACLAGMDTVCGGIRSGQEGKFRTDIFTTGFLSNIIIATTLAWIGDKIFVDLFLAVSLVLGWRIFTNLSLIRRALINEWKDAREKNRLERTSVHNNFQTGISNNPTMGATNPIVSNTDN